MYFVDHNHTFVYNIKKTIATARNVTGSQEQDIFRVFRATTESRNGWQSACVGSGQSNVWCDWIFINISTVLLFDEYSFNYSASGCSMGHDQRFLYVFGGFNAENKSFTRDILKYDTVNG
eukprot:315786_1